MGYGAVSPVAFFISTNMIIRNISLEGNELYIATDTIVSGVTVYIDSINNAANIYSTNSEDHDWAISDYTIEMPSGCTIDISTLEPELDTSAFIVNIDGAVAFYYNEEELYQKEICLLTEYCSTCLDKHQKHRETLFLMKHELLKYAKEHDKLQDQIELYKDIARMLNIDVKYNAKVSHSCLCNNKICCGNCCSIC